MASTRRLEAINAFLFAIIALWTLEAWLRGDIQPSPGYWFQPLPLEELPYSYDIHAPVATIGKLLMQYGPIDPMYERALATHLPHNAQHNYRMSILRRQTAGGLWSKPAYMLQHMLAELEKPEPDRLQWLFWFDSDIILLNPHIPLELFLPPNTNTTKWNHLRAIVCQDHKGLNTGVFALKVDKWSVNLLAATLSFRLSLPHIKLKYNDQSAMEYWLQSDSFRNATMHVPQRWFNAYAGQRGGGGEGVADNPVADPKLPQTGKELANAVREGDLAVHFAGGGERRAPRMLPWLDAAEQRSLRWEVPLRDTGLEKEVGKWWNKEAPREWERVNKLREKCGYEYPRTEPPK